MDPKQNNQPLDPKLQQVYDKVMGTNLGDTSSTPAAPNTSTTPVTPPTSPTTQTEPVLPVADPTVPQPNPAMPEPPVMPPVNPPTDPTLSNPQTPPEFAMPQPVDPTIPGVQPGISTMPEPTPSLPEMPTQPLVQDTSGTMATPPTDEVPTNIPSGDPPAQPADTLQATMPHMNPHDTETVKIGMGGSPVAATVKSKGKGISPVILIFGAFAFLVVYAVFWVRFFGYNIPFLTK